MTKRKFQTKTFICKRAEFMAHSTRTLQQTLQEIMRACPTVGDRKEVATALADSGYTRLISQFKDTTPMFAGVLVGFEPGSQPAYVVEDLTATSLPLDMFQLPETADGKQANFVDGYLFFGVTDNHVVLLQSASIRAIQLERHLNWLLQRRAHDHGAQIVTLMDHTPKATQKSIEKHHVKEVVLGGDFAAGLHHDNQPSGVLPPPDGGTQTASAKLMGTTAANTLRQLITPSDAAKLNLDELEEGSISYTLSIKYKRASAETGQRVLDGLATVFRNLDDTEAKIKLGGTGGEIHGDRLKMQGPARVEIYNGVPVFDQVIEEMRKWLLDKATSNELDA